MKKELKENIKSARILRNLLVTILLMLVIVALCVGLNILIDKLNIPDVDLTQEKLYSLSQESKDKIKSVNKDTKIILYNMDDVKDFAELYNRENSHITCEVLTDVTTRPDLETEYGIGQVNKELIIIENEDRKKQLEQEYTEKRNKIEPELINVLTDVYNKVILSIADEDKEVLVHLINGVLSDAEKNDEFVIKCSPQDYSYISENQGKIFCNMSKDITLDITTDETLGKNDCIIETDGAVFDCSLDKELANLTKKIKMLSCLD